MEGYITIYPSLNLKDESIGKGEYYVLIESLLSMIENYNFKLNKEEKGLLKTLKQIRFKNGKIHANKYQLEKIEDVAYQSLIYFLEEPAINQIVDENTSKNLIVYH